jgi:DNA polymerase-3 subunit delta
MIVTLTGPNSFLLQKRLKELVDEFVAEQGDLALEKIDAENVSEKLVLEAVQATPFLANRKMVVLRSPSNNTSITDHIEQIISSINDTTDLVVYEPVIDRRTSYFKVLKSKTQLEEFGDLDTRSLVNWLVEEAKNQNGELSNYDANYLIERVGSDQQILVNELEKLIIYEPKISRQSIELLTESTPQSKIFELLDAAFTGNKNRALDLYDEQRTQKVEPQLIIGMIAWQLRLIAMAKYAGDRSSGKIAADAGVKPFPVDKARGLSKKIGGNELQSLVTRALQIDYKSKTTSLNLDEALKTYIVSI